MVLPSTRLLAVLIPVLVGGMIAPVAAQSVASGVEADRVVSVGRLIRSGNARNGTPRYGLLDADGRLTAFVVPASGVDLVAHVNQSVVMTARYASRDRDGLPYLLAQHVRVQADESDRGASAVPVGQFEADADPDAAEAESGDEPRLVAEWEDEGALQYLSGASGEWDEPPPPPSPIGAGVDVHHDGDVRPAQHVVDEMIGEAGEILPIAEGETPLFEGGDVTEPYPQVEATEPLYPPGNCHHGAAGVACTSSCCPCGPAGRFWFRTEYLAWWTEPFHAPPLVTTAPITTAAQDAGVLGVSGTEVIAGGRESDNTSRNGVRFLLGAWIDPCQHRGWEVDFFFLSDETDSFSRGSIGDPILARPFFNTQLNLQDAELVAFPGIVTGTVTVDHHSEFQSFAPRFRQNLRCENVGAMACGGCGNCGSCNSGPSFPLGGNRVDVSLGYRYLRLEEGLRISENLISDAETSFATFDIYDAFETSNEFNGFELGLLWDRYRGRWSLELASRFALGNNNRRVAISGATRSVVQGAAFEDVGGLLALPSNIGAYEDDEFVVIPEMSITLGYQLAPQVRFLVGYTFIYWNNVVRPGEHIDLNVNPDLMPPAVSTTGLLAPAFAMNDTSFWAQGINLGLDWRW